MRTLGLNCHYIILMKRARGKTQLRHFAGNAFPGTEMTKFLMEAYDDATQTEPFSYIKIDLTQQIPEKYRVTSRITPEEVSYLNTIFAPTVYVPK